MAKDWDSLTPTYSNGRPQWNPQADYLVSAGFSDALTKDKFISTVNSYGVDAPSYWTDTEQAVRSGYWTTDYSYYRLKQGDTNTKGRWGGYDPQGFNDQNLAAIEKQYNDAVGLAYNGKGVVTTDELFGLGVLAHDIYNIRTALNNQKMQGALADIETGKLQRKQFEQMRKIASEGNEEASEDQRPTGKASVLIGSNIPDRKQKRTSYSRDAGTAKAKVKVQAKGINI